MVHGTPPQNGEHCAQTPGTQSEEMYIFINQEHAHLHSQRVFQIGLLSNSNGLIFSKDGKICFKQNCVEQNTV